MKRFWTKAHAETGAVLLDGKPVRTPKRAPLEVPTSALAEAIAAEWDAVGETLDPRALPLTGLANAAIDIVAPDPAAFADGLARYGETDLLAYRADGPADLVARQAERWDPLLDWARATYGADIALTTGVMHRPQSPEAVERLAAALAAHSPFALAALSPVITIGGSLVVGLALAAHAVPAETLWTAVTLDERYQEEFWGADDLALQARSARKRDWNAAVRFLELLA